MAGGNVGDLTIGLHFDGKKVTAEMAGIKKGLESEGSDSGKKFGGAWAVAAGNLISSGIKKIGSVVTSALGSAISRVDTLNNYPKVMEALGYSSEEASKSVTQISDALDGLPSTLDEVIGDAQKLAATMGNLSKGTVNATSVTLGLNDMFLAGGKGTEAASRAMEQYNQMLAAGKVDQQSWNSLLNAAPGQLDQLSKSLLGAEANQKTLYNALREGKISFDDLNAAIVDLDQNGGKSFASFNDQAVAATQGIGTQLQNIQTSLTKVVSAALEGNTADMEKYLGQLVKRISAVAPQLVSAMAKAVPAIVSAIPELISSILEALEPQIPVILDAIMVGLSSFLERLPEVLQNILNFIMTLAQAVIAYIPQILPQIVQAVMGIIVMLTAPENIQALLNGAITLFMALVQAIPQIIIALINAVPDIIMNLIDFFTDPSTVLMIVKAAVQLFMGLVQAVPQILGALFGAFGSLFTKLWDKLKTTFGSFVAKFGEFLSGIFKAAINGVLGFIEGFINAPINLINGFIGAINGAFGFIGVHLDTIATIQLPRLAEGGYAGAGASTAIIGEEGKEVVLPLENNTDNWSGLLANALAEKFNEDGDGIAGSGITIENQNFNISNQLDAENIGHIMMQSIRRQAR